MNDARCKQIQRALTLIGEAKAILEVALTQEQDDYDNMLSETTMRGKERRIQSTHWSVPRWAAAMRLPPARRRCRISTNIADEIQHRRPVLDERASGPHHAVWCKQRFPEAGRIALNSALKRPNFRL